MIGFEYHGQVNYISRIEDFRDFMEPSVYEALQKAMGTGIGDDYKEKYEELQEDYEELKSDYEDLELIEDELHDCENELESMEEKYEALQKCIKVLINQLYFGFVKQDDVIPELEKLV